MLVVLREGAKVCFTGRKKEEADALGGEAVKNGYNIDNLLFVEGDITNEDILQDQIKQCVEKFGRVDCVFANAGRHMVGNVVDTSLEQWRQMFSVDVEGVFLTLKYTIPQLQKNGKGSIVIM